MSIILSTIILRLLRELISKGLLRTFIADQFVKSYLRTD